MKNIILTLIMVCSLFIYVRPAFASTPVLPGGGDSTQCKCEDIAKNNGEGATEVCKKYCGVYQLDDGLLLVKKVVLIFIGISGGLALLAFVAGGLMFVFSAGSKSWVERGKTTIIGAVIGLAIVFFSYTIVLYVFQSLTKGSSYRDDPFQSGMDSKYTPVPSQQDFNNNAREGSQMVP